MPRRPRRSSGSTPGRCLGRTRARGPWCRSPSTRTHSGTSRGSWRCRSTAGEVDWSPDLVFPGPGRTSDLIRHTIVPERAPILAKDGTPLAEGPADARTSPLGAAATAISGSVGTPKHKQEPELAKLGFPPGARPGRAASSWRSTSGSPAIREASSSPSRPAADAVGGRSRARFEQADPRQAGPYDDRPRPPALSRRRPWEHVRRRGRARRPHRGGPGGRGARVLRAAAAGLDVQAVTTTAALESGDVKVSDTFPIQTSTTVDGRQIDNANQEACGGTFSEAFAESCNSVFAPLGPKVGTKGWSTPPRATASTRHRALHESAQRRRRIPSNTIPKSIPSDVDLAVTAIGQGEVLATPLEMAPWPRRSPTAACSIRRRSSTDHTLQSDLKPSRVTSTRSRARSAA